MELSQGIDAFVSKVRRNVKMNDRERVERFTNQAINTLHLAREEAERYQHSSIGRW